MATHVHRDLGAEAITTSASLISSSTCPHERVRVPALAFLTGAIIAAARLPAGAALAPAPDAFRSRKRKEPCLSPSDPRVRWASAAVSRGWALDGFAEIDCRLGGTRCCRLIARCSSASVASAPPGTVTRLRPSVVWMRMTRGVVVVVSSPPRTRSSAGRDECTARSPTSRDATAIAREVFQLRLLTLFNPLAWPPRVLRIWGCCVCNT